MGLGSHKRAAITATDLIEIPGKIEVVVSRDLCKTSILRVRKDHEFGNWKIV